MTDIHAATDTFVPEVPTLKMPKFDLVDAVLLLSAVCMVVLAYQAFQVRKEIRSYDASLDNAVSSLKRRMASNGGTTPTPDGPQPVDSDRLRLVKPDDTDEDTTQPSA